MNMQLDAPTTSIILHGGLRHESLSPIASERGGLSGSMVVRFAALGVCLAVLLFHSARGADQSTASARLSNELEEIVVTAEKREATVQSTPISLTAITGDQLAAQGIDGLSGIVAEVPGISMRTSGPGQTELEMRGLASSGGSSPTVGFYIDDIALSPAAGTLIGKVVVDPDLFDLNRVEVLRGPQGTLYGSGSMGGTIKLITNQPNLQKTGGEVAGSLSGTRGGGENPGIDAMINIPLIDNKLALRAVVTERYTSGWIDRDVVADFPFPINPCPAWPAGCTRGNVLAAPITQRNKDVNWENLTSGRLNLLYKPTDQLSIDVFGLDQRIRMGGYSDYDVPPGATYEAHYQPFDIAEPFQDEFSLVGLTVSYDFDFAKLTSVSSYYRRSEKQSQDSSEALESFISAILGIQEFVPSAFLEWDQSAQYGEELRLASTGNSPFQWIGGMYFSKFKSIYETYDGNPAFAALSTGGAAANPNGIIFASYDPTWLSQYAVFGEASYQFTASWKATVGLRAYEFKFDTNEPSSGVFGASGNMTSIGERFHTSNNSVTPKFNLAYEPNTNLTVYSTASKGVRPGGANIPIPTSVGCALTSETYGPDSIWNYELGEKARSADHRFTINSDFYYIKWNEVQQLVTQSCGFGLTVNAGSARSFGPELEVTAQLSDNLIFSITGTYTKADITHVNPAVGAADPTLVQGFPILNIPNYTETTTLTYKHPIGADKELTASVNNSYIGSSTDVSFYYEKLHPYDIVKLRLGLDNPSWAGYFFVNNLTNTRAELSINTTSLSYLIPSLTRVSTNQPLTIGVEGSYRF
jgi:iron complex outermembrane receptor protein